MSKKVLVITNHRKNRSPGQRFRFEQYLDFLEENGFEITISFLLNEKDDKHFYNKSFPIIKAIILLKSFIKRYIEAKTYNNYDIIFVYREAFFTGSTIFEKKIAKSKAKFIFDFDDAIWLHDVSEGNKKWGWLKKPEKTIEIIQLSDMVFAGNKYLVDFSKKYNSNVVLIPTTIDTNYHIPEIKAKTKNQICIGWTGSSTTLKYFENFIPTLEKISTKYPGIINFKVIVDLKKTYPTLNITTTLWNLEKEIEDLNKIDIGIMPLPNDKWTKGKCGFKGLQYMSLVIPTIMSPIGVNTEIINDGINGFLASTEEEWISKISLLIESVELRNQIGKAGFETIKNKYSIEANKKKYLDSFNSLL
ncbi:glycosyltransferase [Vicingus serpentipes]|uniref:Glycosyltransferase n=1 Tax=Vicingus serpentipes TaxID=1926625 RepID=A0A5C6S0B1_9FLAO|nr:glycosyltransferase [Vicingus serpentipes]TXB67280.1 glycosyltransferase [Vicingus serpentipes]